MFSGPRQVAAISGAAVLALGLGGAAWYMSGHKSSDKSSNTAHSGPSASPTPTDPADVGKAFLAAWSSGNYTSAASYTDAPDLAAPRLKEVMGALKAQSLQVQFTNSAKATPTPSATATATATATSTGTPTTTPTGPAETPVSTVNYHVTMAFGTNLSWSYDNSLTVVQVNGQPKVKWASKVINSELPSSSFLLEAATPPQTVTDANGAALNTAAFPSLAPVAAKLKTTPAPGTTPTQLVINLVDKGNNSVKGIVTTIGTASSTPAVVKTTISPAYQAAAEAAMHIPQLAGKTAGMVVLSASTGHILAFSNSPAGGSNTAFQAGQAPGSTMKVITTAALLTSGVKTTDPAPCTQFATVQGLQIHNSDGNETNPKADLHYGFLVSCNTSFVNLYLQHRIAEPNALADEAHNYFGLNQPWNLGLGAATYGTPGDLNVTPVSGSGFAQTLFGQYRVVMSPLTMASAAATIDHGSFVQPTLVVGQQPIASAQPLPTAVDSQLKSLMQGVVSNPIGTAYGVFDGLGTVYAKTGTAERDGHKPNSWMVAFRGDIAIACLVEDAGYGRDYAGPAIASVLRAVG